ncbi:Y4yA family PLP-dependent enzyme [Streptomyces halobius]|uniref:Y4yA family PLP-dependent enzyme n=1 Tax=Streptomyces halobius TaxID=2879846 RepID=A0ABY4MHN6_9ACTN|nr:Y4yA family PLP-dependent enzyme [Streptomyces halobius]UQA97253.1 Y4yA family PLP-dependent enzyme [Streptomyces halobius]
MDGAPLYLEPHLEPPLASLLESAAFLHMLVDALGSPVNVVLPDQIARNVERFRTAYRRHNLVGQVFFAHKANRSSALVRRLAATDAGIDVASLAELQHALGAGFTPDRILATGPKSPEFRWLAARSGVTVSADGPGELEELDALVRRHGLPRVRVLLRLSEFETPGAKVLSRQTRFGTSIGSLDQLLDVVERHQETLQPIGVAYHLDTTSLDEKAIAFEGCLLAMDALRKRGFQPRVIDIGGGFGVNYLAHAAQWERFTTELAHAVLGKRPPMTWSGHGYGLRAEGGTLRGALSLYPAHRPVAGAAYLDELLSLPAPALGRPLGTLLLENLYDLHTEPGRSLVDQCGLSLARVLEVRRTDAGVCLVRLAMKASDASLEEHGVLMDPVLLPRSDAHAVTESTARYGGTERAAAARSTEATAGATSAGATSAGATSAAPASPTPVAVHLTGNLCLEADLITRRTVHLPRLPQPGDLLAFVNTAGYCMDFSATHAQQQPVARKVAVHRDGGSWRWCLDEQYWPIIRPGGQQI